MVLRKRASLLWIPDTLLAVTAWGSDRARWPRHWRKELVTTLRSLTVLHFVDVQSVPTFGTHTALLTNVGDLRGTPDDACNADCPAAGVRGHSHLLINVGRGYLGCLESCAESDDQSGVRHYSFPIDSRNTSTATLRKLGKTGRLMSVYSPAVLGNYDNHLRFSVNQQRMFRAIVRERTRKSKSERRDVGEAEIFTGNMVPLMSSRRPGCCSELDAAVTYVGFNGNGKRKRLGYLLNSHGGWLAKAGYTLGDIKQFLSDLQHLSRSLGLIVVGLLPADRSWRSLATMQEMLSTPVSRALLERLHVRVYTPSDYVDRWGRFFGWSDTTSTPIAPPQPHDDVRLELQKRAQIRGFRRALVGALGFDPSLLSKVLNGKKPWPDAWLLRAGNWLAEQRAHPVTSSSSSILTGAAPEQTFESVALSYLDRGFSTVPLLAGYKRPCVRWKVFQERIPTEQEIGNWARRWPEAGLALVLGLVSGVFVIDVDGSEAHQALLDRLGSEPQAPKVLSGSRQPDRYHLFFRHPDLATRAKATPWHPKLEFRGQGGLVVLPPSIHASGNAYVWAEGRSLDDLALPELPMSILTALACRSELIAPPPSPVQVGELIGSPSTREFLTGRFAEAPNWNGRLFAAACDLAGRRVSQDEAQRLLLVAARPWNQSERENAIRTIESAYQQPRVPARV